MKNNVEKQIKILKMYAYGIKKAGIAIWAIACMPGAATLMRDGPTSLFFGVVCGGLSFLCCRVLAAFIEAYANKCEDVHNIYMLIEKNGKKEISDNQ